MTKRYVAALILAACPAFASAQYYGGLSIGQNRADFYMNDYSLGRNDVQETQERRKNAYKIFAGYDFNPYLAIEGGYARLGRPAYRYSGTDWSGRAYIIQASIFLAGKVTAPLSENFRVFAKVGSTYSRARLRGNSSNAVFNAERGFPTSISENNHRLMMSLGLEYRLSRHLFLRAEYDDFGKFGDSAVTGATKARMTSVGLTYHMD